ncbi:hypothetical protein CR203_01145 [Salipaludibacillus neizhouensis]|uniref:DUF2157 domain-containing protein n=1 Tax=Salipaludibacillus neizhouensis TaxID=885475 RepID=A0A3A9K915_9BACI|nr:hypothetical protein [Salipaludibacillus neizhouensis]RKL68689.1 hypothetical protein CR203_01145 [Salipaludibacillus neizhouensis]
MEESKNDIIINEIKKWQENKLLPETYCRFLLSLYTEGELQEENENRSTAIKAILKNSRKVIVSFLIMIVIITILLAIIFFVQFSSVVQLSGLGGFLILGIIGARNYNNKSKPISHLFVVLSTFISFILLIVTVEEFFYDNLFALGTGIVLLCIVWIIVGWRFRYHYLYIAGGTGILLFIALVVGQGI